MKIAKIDNVEFDFIYKELEKNFIRDERRDYFEARAVLDNESYSVYHIIDGEDKIGFITLWKLSGFTFAEHFVIYEEYRNRGYGGIALRLIEDQFKKIVLECEAPVTDMQKRRFAFYERNGFYKNDTEYIQPSYRKDGCGVSLLLMSYPTRLSDVEASISDIYKTVYKKEYKRKTL